MRRIAVLDAPSNLGLRPPTESSVPGCGKAPGALRDHRLLDRLGARDAGCLTPPRYDPGDWRPGDGVCHAEEIAAYSVRLADRIGAILAAGEFPLVLGGDCSVLLGAALAMHRHGERVGGRVGLVFIDGHSDFRHPGNAPYVGAAAGEDLALVTGRGQADLTGIEGRRPYFRDVDVIVLGIREHDDYRLDLQAAGIQYRAVPALRAEGPARTAQWAREELADCVGFWVHVDVDVLDPAVMPAVDAPDPGGIAYAELEALLAGLVAAPRCLGMELTVFDPDYDPDGTYAGEVVATITAGLAPLLTGAEAEPRAKSHAGVEAEPGAEAEPGSGAVAVPGVPPPAQAIPVIPAQAAPVEPKRLPGVAVAELAEPSPPAEPGPPASEPAEPSVVGADGAEPAEAQAVAGEPAEVEAVAGAPAEVEAGASEPVEVAAESPEPSAPDAAAREPAQAEPVGSGTAVAGDPVPADPERAPADRLAVPMQRRDGSPRLAAPPAPLPPTARAPHDG
jgi:arginase